MNLSSKEILRYTNPEAVYGVRRVEVTQGRGQGTKLIEVKTTDGLFATFNESRCLDILDLSYKGVNMGFLSKNGIVSRHNPEADGFTEYWAGGFMSTCGLRNAGPPCTHDGEYFPFHGKVGITPADGVNASVFDSDLLSGDDRTIVIQGKICETSLFGHALEMERKISIPIHGSKIRVRDIVRNLTDREEPIFMIYHINFGWPFLSEDLAVQLPPGEVTGRTPLATKSIADHAKITPPIDSAEELVYFVTPRDETPTVTLTNKPLGIQACVRYDSTKLPILTQWKCMRSGTYALGIEPGTSYLGGRAHELENGYDICVPAFGMMEFGVEMEVRGLDARG